ncbi:hypothetical protein ACFSQT_13540 [Mesorhizobium calcicola]|uniref:Uncharacterized protein n=1 Tax=Mesorhizobium calcicola TaxID=1300310 RepID=A0ABW4WBY2_9HYPH
MGVVLRLGMTDENAFARESPIAPDHGRMRVIAAGDEGQAAVLNVRQHAVGDEIPLVAQPDGRGIVLGPVEHRGELVDDGHRAMFGVARIAEGDAVAVIGSVVVPVARGCVPISADRMRIVVILRFIVVRIGRETADRDEEVGGRARPRGVRRSAVRRRDDARASRRVAGGLEGHHRRGGEIADKGLERRRAPKTAVLLQAGIAGPLHVAVIGAVVRRHHVRHVAVPGRNEPVGRSAGRGAGRHIADELVPAVCDPEHGGISGIGQEGEFRDALGVFIGGEDARDQPRILSIGHRGAGEDAEIAVKLVVGLGAVLEIEAMADRLVPDIAGKQDALRGVKHDPAGHRFVDRRILHEGSRRGLAGHVEMDRIVRHPSTLPELLEFDSLDVNRLEPLPEHDLTAERITRAFLVLGDTRVLWGRVRKFVARRVASGDDPDAAVQDGDGGSGLDAVLDEIGVEIESPLRQRQPIGEHVALAVVRPGSAVIDPDLLEPLSGGTVARAGRLDNEGFGMTGQIIGRRHDDLIAGFDMQVLRMVVARARDDERIVRPRAAACRNRSFQPGPTRMRQLRIGAAERVAGAFRAPELEASAIGDGEDLVAEIPDLLALVVAGRLARPDRAVGAFAVAVQRPVAVEEVRDVARQNKLRLAIVAPDGGGNAARAGLGILDRPAQGTECRTRRVPVGAIEMDRQDAAIDPVGLSR